MTVKSVILLNKPFCLHILCVLLFLLMFSLTKAFLSEEDWSRRCIHPNRTSNTAHSIVALILARGGSKGIRFKNLAKISDISLLGRALRIIHNCRNCFDEVWVSTDSKLIAQEAQRFNARVHYRSDYSARDEATSVESIQEFLDGHPYIQNIALIQCTSVFIYEQYLEAAVKKFKSGRFDCVFSVQRSFKLRWQQERQSNQLKALNFNPKQRPRRQDWSGELAETGMFYFARRRLIETEGVLQNERCDFVEIDEQHVLEIDHPHQLRLANILVND